MPGPPRKPTKLKLLEGNPGHQKLNKHEPQPALATPTAPKWMKGAALEMWGRIVPELDRLGMLTVVDQGALEGACAAYGQAIECRLHIQKNGQTFKEGEAGYPWQRPEVSIEKQAWKQWDSLGSKFGLTPADRAKLTMGAELSKRDTVEDAMFGS